ncbi:MAG: sugar nucleotide-binding protein [Bacteroidaceae bacterium]|nr:sugar nucleotide-binding protein [Bacteroidaceae bacterium]
MERDIKILITGSTGFLGCRLKNYYQERYALICPGHHEMDITSETSVMEYLAAHEPIVVIHCAAISSTGYCQEHPEESHLVNVLGTENLAKACKQVGAKFIFMSSDQVYNGTPLKGLLTEEAPLQPVSVYGKDKLEAEHRVLKILPDSIGLRLTWMYDLPESPLKQNTGILLNLKKAWENGETLKAAVHEYRGITYVWEVVKNMEKMLHAPGGIYNFGSENTECSYHTFLKFAKQIKLPHPEEWILADEERFAAQDRNLSINISKIRQLGIDFTPN